MSQISVDSVIPQSGTSITIGGSGDTVSLGSGASASGFGKVLQVVSATYGTQASTSSNSWIATGLTVSITPSSTSNKVLALLELPMAQKTTANSTRYATGTLFRDSTNLGDATYGMGMLWTGNQNGDWDSANIGTCYLDSPSTTSSVTYTAYFRCLNGDTAYAFTNNSLGTLTLMEIAG